MTKYKIIKEHKMLFVLEMANNHRGSMAEGKRIIDAFHNVVKNYPMFEFAFKFQRRCLSHIIHPDYIGRDDFPAIKRFRETQLSVDQLSELMVHASSLGFQLICTPFDEKAVDDIRYWGLNYIKVGSCSINDWPLWNKVAETKFPVIASVGGIDNDDIQKVVSFCEHRNINLSLLHCVGLYPTPEDSVGLNRLNDLKQWGVPIGFSSHESGGQSLSIALAINQGATIIEKHVDIDPYKGNTYSILPSDLNEILKTAVSAQNLYRAKCWYGNIQDKENAKLRDYKRGAFLKEDVGRGEEIYRDMLFFAMPILGNDHIDVSRCNKYTYFRSSTSLKAGDPLLDTEVTACDNESNILQIHSWATYLLKKYNLLSLCKNCKMEISHHRGLQSFYNIGMCLITLINKEYCKKLLLLSEGQINPTHYHLKKKETFFVQYGEVTIKVNDNTHILTRGDMLTIEPNQRHSIQAVTDVIIEEISTKHIPEDSYYNDASINDNPNRKTLVYL